MKSGFPDPRLEPDGSWIRTAGGIAVWVPSVTASEIDFVPAGTIAATDVQAAIEEVAAEASGAVSSVFTRTGAVTAASSDYDAVQVDFTPAGTIAATNVQAAIEEVAAEAGGGVPTSRTLTAGAALTGGGDLTTDRTFDVAVDGSTIEVSSDALRVKAGGIGANELASTAVTPATYGDATHVGAFTVDADGRITSASAVAITATGGSGSELDYAQITSPVSVTVTTEGTAVTVVDGNSVTYDGTAVMVEFWCPHFNNPASQNMFLVLLRDTTVLGRAFLTMGGSAVADLPGIVRFRDTPSAAAHTYHAKAYVSGGTGSIKAGAGGTGTDLPAFLRVTKA